MTILWLTVIIGAQCGPEGCLVPSWPATTITLELDPPNGQVWFDGYEVTVSDGRSRVRTPPLQPGRRYRYHVTARWGDVERHWVLRFAPGETLHIRLRRDDPEQPHKPDEAPKPQPKPLGPLMPTIDGQAPVVERDGVANYGIDRAMLEGGAERITLEGQPITRADAQRILESSGLIDDRDKLRLTIIGSDADRQRVLADLRGPLADIAAQCLVQAYPPDHWAVTGVGFYTKGSPTIYMQQSDGAVLHRQDDYSDGADGLRKAYERLRKPDPNYRPDKDRDLRRPGEGILARLLYMLSHPFRVILSWVIAVAMVYVAIVAVAKGWLWFALAYIARLIPSPPERQQTAIEVTTAKKKTRASRAQKT